MKAYQVVEFGAPIQARNLPDPVPEGSQVVVDVTHCGLCHSDLHFHDGYIGMGGGTKLGLQSIGANLPLTLGHEICGRISAFGLNSGLRPADKGRPVIVYPWIGCGTCEACIAERDNECPRPQNIGLHLPGGHGEKVVVRDPKFLIDATGIDPDSAGIYACSGLTAYSALEKIHRKDQWIGIIGVGGVGLAAVAIAKGVGFKKVVAIDVDDNKLGIAKEFGADIVINSRTENCLAEIKAKTGGLVGAIDLVGSDGTIQLALGTILRGGTYVVVGLFGGLLQFPAAALATQQLTIRGSFVGTPAQLRALVGHVRTGAIKPIPVRSAPVTDLNKDLSALRAGAIEGRVVHCHSPSADTSPKC